MIDGMGGGVLGSILDDLKTRIARRFLKAVSKRSETLGRSPGDTITKAQSQNNDHLTKIYKVIPWKSPCFRRLGEG
jgi:hypothetical protein